MLNRVVLIGRNVRDLELNYTNNGNAVLNFTLAVERPYTNQDGVKDVDFIDCVAWRKQAENTAQYVNKGDKLAVDGRIEITSYTDKNGNNRKKTEIVAESVTFLEGKKDDNNNQQIQQPIQQPAPQQMQQPQQQVQQGVYTQQQSVQQQNNNPQGYPQQTQVNPNAFPF